jgi:DNA-binding CsgD family transcriptional regulator
MVPQQIFRFIDYLTTNPSIHDLCAHILDDFDLPEHPEKIRVLWKSDNHGLEIIGQYGYEHDVSEIAAINMGQRYEFDHWSQVSAEGMEIIKGDVEGPWSRNGNAYVHKITHNFLIVGYIKLTFEGLNRLQERYVEERLALVFAILNLYIIQEMKRIHQLALVEGQIVSIGGGLDAKSRFALLTPRQVQILRYIGEKKTNAQIGKCLGYATTTIHAECSDIYNLLAVGNRSQAYTLVADFLK